MTRKLTPAVAYVRKSTAGEKPDGSERQERSIPAQRAEIKRQAKSNGYKIIRWFEDAGVSGWKRGEKRPGFHRLLESARKDADFEAVLCDDLDRFSRAKVPEVFSDLHDLASAGVKTIATNSRGEYELSGHDIGAILTLAVDIFDGYQYSRKLGRRIGISRRNAAKEGKRSGGSPPYGMANGDGGKLKRGKAFEVRTVKRIFKWFVDAKMSLRGIATKLNQELKIASPGGGKWSSESIKRILSQESYIGTLTYNKKKSGAFFILDAYGELVDAENRPSPAWKETEVGVIRIPKMWKGIVAKQQFDAAQKRLAGFARDKQRRPRSNSRPLIGTLYCDNCGKKMHATKARGRYEYRCGTNMNYGNGSCGNWAIKEDDILPVVLNTLSEEMDQLKKNLAPSICPTLESKQQDDLADLQDRRAELNNKIENALESIFVPKSEAIRKRMGQKLDEMQAELQELDDQIAAAPEEPDGFLSDEWFEHVDKWWEERSPIFVPYSKPVEVKVSIDGFPIDEVSCPNASAFMNAFGGEHHDSAVIRETLVEMGAEVRLRWKQEEQTTKKGKKRMRNVLIGGRLRLGTTDATVCTSPAEESSNDNFDADRFDNHRGKDSAPRSKRSPLGMSWTLTLERSLRCLPPAVDGALRAYGD